MVFYDLKKSSIVFRIRSR